MMNIIDLTVIEKLIIIESRTTNKISSGDFDSGEH